ncbi:MAG: Uncharacterised protein [Methanobacteriota archaeon]|nr:MAG: Uncharacterised protein [Euryarchaeota archaeon]
MDNRRRPRKNEPFDPFAPNAAKRAQVRKQQSSQRREPVNQNRSVVEPTRATTDRQSELEAKAKAARDALNIPKTVEVPTPKPKEEKVVPKPPAKSETKEKPVEKTVAEVVETTPKRRNIPKPRSPPKSQPKKPSNREDRLASLRAKSAATAEFAKQAKEGNLVNSNEEIPDIKDENEEIIIEESELVVDEEFVNKKTVREENVLNVFKTIKTEKVKADRRPKRRRMDKKGGGRQPQSKKLDRRKYLEYKYVARDLLDDDSISEENRSNVLGQIWAKGERIGVEEAISFINQKEQELIITPEVAEEFRKIVRKYTTKR